MSVRTEAAMGTLVTMQVVHDVDTAAVNSAMDRAFGWFHEIEEHCTRFSEQSEFVQLTKRIGEPVTASPILFEAVRFALLVAEETDGAFDPTIGQPHGSARLQPRTPHRRNRCPPRSTQIDDVTYRDVVMDAEARTITLLRPLTLDLGAVAKGLAVDIATRELQPFGDFAVDAGGDIYLGGSNPQGEAVVGWDSSSTPRRRTDRFIAGIGPGRLHFRRL